MSDSSRNVCAARSPRSSFCASTTRASQKKKIQGVTTSTMSVLKKYSWLRHIRELENLIERSSPSATMTTHLRRGPAARITFRAIEPQGTRTDSLFEDATNTFERATSSLRALEKCEWNVTGTAEHLGMPLSTLKYKMDALDVRQLATRLRGA